MSMTVAADRWVLATGNRGKLAELNAMLAGSGIEVIAQGDLGVGSVAETGATFVENALQKARHACAETGLPAIADDSGLIVAALDGAPGVLSARFAGPGSNDVDNVAKLLDELSALRGADRRARFHCVIVALRHPTDPAPAIAEGRWEGLIAPEPRGSAGFGYDPVFFDPELGMTAAELSLEIKNRRSHRARALAALAASLAVAPASG